MHRRAIQVLGCPECGLPFLGSSLLSETIDVGILRCSQAHEFEIADGVPLLVRESERPRLLAFADSYGPVWAKDGWGGSDREYLRSLPYHDTTHRRVAEWKVKARSMDALLRFLDPQKWPRVVDLGCGMGWLSHHLAVRGHEVYAIDVVLDGTVGLGAAGTYVRMGPAFERVWAGLHRLPFLSSSVDVVVCNASLHYASDLGISLGEIARILRPGGLVAILNSPVHSRGSSTVRAQSDFRTHLRALGATDDVMSVYHHFTRSELEAGLRTAVGPVNEIRFDPGRWFRWSRRVKGLVLQMELASFPILTATKAARPPIA